VKRAGLLAYPPVDTLAQEIPVPDMARILFGWLTDPRHNLDHVSRKPRDQRRRSDR
jgi:hypothetical protein